MGLYETVNQVTGLGWVVFQMVFTKRTKKRAKARTRGKKKDPIFVDGKRPRPMYVDYKDVELLKKLINRHGKIVSRRKTGCTAASQHAVTEAIKRARFMALLPYVGE
jgi:small subunit ribosomal protein S18